LIPAIVTAVWSSVSKKERGQARLPDPETFRVELIAWIERLADMKNRTTLKDSGSGRRGLPPLLFLIK
jgi:hypothetical protein